MPPGVRLGAVLTAVVAVLSAVPAVQFTHWQWIAFAVTAVVVLGLGAPVHRAAAGALRRGRVGTDVLVAAGPLAALGWSTHALLGGGAGDPGLTQTLTDRTLALDAAALLTVLALAGLREPGTRGRDRWEVAGAAVPGVAAAVLGFGLGTGAGIGAVAGAVAVLVAGCPCALWVAGRWAGPPRTAGPVARCGDPEVLRLAAALLAAHPDDPLARAVVTAAGAELPGVSDADGLPGVSDADGLPATGLRGVVSELRGDAVVAHAVLAGPASWLAAHGVAAPEGAGQVLVAWDGVPRGRIAIVPTPPREAGASRVAQYVAVTCSLAGVALAALGTLGPATAGVVPAAVAVVVAVLVGGAAAIRARRRHPIGATA